MKDQKKEKKLRLGKIRIQNLEAVFERESLDAIKAGVGTGTEPGTTILPIFCI